MTKPPFSGLCLQLLLTERDFRILLGKLRNDFKVVLLIWALIADAETEACHKRELLLHGIGMMQLVIVIDIVAVLPCFPYQMAPVAGGIDQDMLESGLLCRHRLYHFRFLRRGNQPVIVKEA